MFRSEAALRQREGLAIGAEARRVEDHRRHLAHLLPALQPELLQAGGGGELLLGSFNESGKTFLAVLALAADPRGAHLSTAQVSAGGHRGRGRKWFQRSCQLLDRVLRPQQLENARPFFSEYYN